MWQPLAEVATISQVLINPSCTAHLPVGASSPAKVPSAGRNRLSASSRRSLGLNFGSGGRYPLSVQSEPGPYATLAATGPMPCRIHIEKAVFDRLLKRAPAVLDSSSRRNREQHHALLCMNRTEKDGEVSVRRRASSAVFPCAMAML
ncbi:hypothetical protein LIA77_11813 [Sarocladium implicatum]|nr:hypothetical protein LIA77_11813 [Sarocladium implicatum]